MKNKKQKPKPMHLKTNNKKSESRQGGFVFKQDAKRRKKDEFFDDDEVGSEYSDDAGEEDYYGGRGGSDSSDEDNGVKGRVMLEGEGDEFEKETANERRIRLAKQHLDQIRSLTKRKKEEEDDDDEDEEESGKLGVRDSLVAKILQQKHLEESGRTRKSIASRVQKSQTDEQPRVLVKHRQSVTAVALSHDDLKGFSASKDGTIVHWDVESGKMEKYIWPSEDVLKSHGAKDPQGQAIKHSKHVLALAVTTDGRYLATGGLDRHVHLWDVRTHEHIQVGTTELFSGSFDRSIRIWNAEDRAFIAPLFGHQSELLTIDCLRKERALTVGRDRTMQLYKVPEESHVVFRSSASLECGCFISDDAFLSGSDDGSIQLWSLSKKKPVFIVKNAHALLPMESRGTDSERIPNGHCENNSFKADNPCSTVHSWVGSVAVCPNSDLAASGAGNGFIRLWAIENENRGIQPLFHLPITGFVNSLAFAKSGQFLIAGIGKEPRLGRWGRLPCARNGVVLQSLKLS
ncbi:hypothetical protein Dimus_010006 [Dionaea muscipula]